MVAEEYRVGGTCVIRGCVPKKLLVYASRFSDEFEDAASGRVFQGFTSPVQDDRGGSLGRIWTLREVTQQRELDRLKDDFVATVSHELRTPLTSMMGFLEMIREGEAGELNDQQKRFLAIVYRSSERLQRLVGDLLFVARLDANGLQLRFGEARLDEIVRESVESSSALARSREVELVAEVDDVPPVTGFLTIDALLSGEKGAFKSAVTHLILPTIVLGTNPLAIIARMTRSAMLEVLGEDYIRTARAKGLSKVRVVALHAFRNALIPLITLVGLSLPDLFGGAFLIETIFAWNGMGRLTVQAVQRSDYTLIMGSTLVFAVLTMFGNLLADILYGVFDPRIRFN
jgi:hypothetical protein